MLEDVPPKPGKVLMENGHWLIPVEERPKDWERYELLEPIERPAHAAPILQSPIAIPSPEPTEEEVAGAVVDVAAQMAPSRQEILDNSGDKTGTIRAKARKYQRDLADAHKAFAEICRAIRASAKNFGAEPRLEKYARLMVAGLRSGRTSRLVGWSGLSVEEVGAASLRFLRAGIWSIDIEQPPADKEPRGYLVHMGDDSPEADMGFWLNVMVGAGEIEGVMREDGRGVYAAKGVTLPGAGAGL